MSFLLPFFCGLAAGTISAWGVGGGTLLLLVMTLFLGVDQRTAQGINLLFFLLSAGASLLVHRKERRIPRRLVRHLILWAIPGALVGCYLVRVLDATIIRKLFGGMLVATGLPALLVRRRARSPEK